MDIEFDCPHCKQHLAIDSRAAGTQTRCPTCGNSVSVPMPPSPVASDVSGASQAGVLPGIIYCARCGQQNPESGRTCSRCGAPLHEAGKTQYVVTDSGFGALIPYKNPWALWAYYLGIFSLIPCFGVPLGIAAFIIGILGVRYANRQPQVKGKGHAWAGIILGAVSVLGQAGLIVLLIATRALH